MANTRISDLAAGAAVAGTDLFPDVQTAGIGPVKVTAAQIKTFTSSSPTLVTPNIGVATGTSLDVSGVLESGTNAGTGGQLKMFGATSGDVTLKVAAAAGTATNFTLPASNGTNNYALLTDGSGVTSWGQISLTAAITGTLPVGNGGTGITSGTSGGVLYYSATNTLASSAALAANAIVIGGGAGAAPSTTTTGTGVVTAIGNNTNAAGGLVTSDGTATLTNKRITARSTTTTINTQNPTFTPDSDAYDQVNIIAGYTAGISTVTIASPTGTPTDGQRLILRLYSTNTNAVTLSFTGSNINGSTDITLPASMSANSKYDYLGLMWNAVTSKWNMVSRVQGFA